MQTPPEPKTFLESAAPIVALIISIAAFIMSLVNRRDNKQARLWEKKTELVTRLAEQVSKFDFLIQIRLHRMELLNKEIDAGDNRKEFFHVNDRFNWAMEERGLIKERLERTRDESYSDLAELEKMLGDANSELAAVTADLEKEQSNFAIESKRSQA